MANLKIATADYETLVNFMDGRDHVTIGSNTHLVHHARIGRVGVVLHSTEVVTVDLLGNVELHTGGWKTPTTKDRIINQFLSSLPGQPGVHSVKGEWYLLIRGAGHGPFDLEEPFYEGISLTRNGNLGRLKDFEAAA